MNKTATRKATKMDYAKAILEKELNKIATKKGAVRKNNFGPEYQVMMRTRISDLQNALEVLCYYK